MDLKEHIRSIQDYPKKGILFRDITTLIKNDTNLGHGGNLKKAIDTAFLDGADFACEIHADNQYWRKISISLFFC